MEELKNLVLEELEITPIYGVKGYEDKDLSFLSSEWMEEFSYTLQEGKD
ncbi:MAG: hypothetical protein H6613_02905 [Ignavibacteriales bacterium]|nr:hypothetical protein [Ignavibacteriales bacterium]